jgi:hypothetical protein
MGSLLDDIRNGIRDGIDLFVDKTEEYGKIGKLNIDILGIKRNLEKELANVGGRVYELFKADSKKTIVTDEKVLAFIEAVKQLEEKLEAKKAEIQQVKDEKEKERKEREEKRQAEKPPDAAQ